MISLCVPTRGRPGRFAEMLESATRTASGKIEVVGWQDEDDPTAAQYPQEGVIYGRAPRPLDGKFVQMSGLWTRAWELATGDVAMLCGDDVIFETPGWDDAVSRAFEAVPDRILMVYADDGSPRKAPVLPFVSREWIDAAGFTPPDLQGWFADEWLWSMAAEVRRVVFLDGVMIRHNQLGGDRTYRDGAAARQRQGGLQGMRHRFYFPEAVARRDELVAKLRTVMRPGSDLVPTPIPKWFTQSVKQAAAARPAPVLSELNPDTLIVVHCWQGDAQQVVDALPVHLRHGCPVLILSPEDSPVKIDHPGVECRSVGPRGYFGQESLDRQRAHLELLLTYPQNYFLLNDADSMCLSAKIPKYVYGSDSEDTVFSNEVREGRPHKSPYPKIAFQPPYFVSRGVIERLLSVNVPAHPITPFIDWYMVALTYEAGLRHRSFRDGASFPAWKRNPIPETVQLGHDYRHEEIPKGRIDGERGMLQRVTQGAVFIHSVKHKHVLDRLVRAAGKAKGPLIQVTTATATERKPVLVEPRQVGLDRVSILVPFRDDGDRGSTWAWVRARWEVELPGAEIVVGTDDGEPFSKTVAVNDAASRATGDIFVVTDADSWMNGETIREAIEQTWALRRLIIPWQRVVRLNDESTQQLMTGSSEITPQMRKAVSASSPRPLTAGVLFVISREAFEDVNGMDPRFRGWGYEDISFRRCCDALLGKTRYLRGTAYSLWHPRTTAGRRGRIWGAADLGEMNMLLNSLYIKAERRPGAMMELRNQHPFGAEATVAKISQTSATHPRVPRPRTDLITISKMRQIPR